MGEEEKGERHDIFYKSEAKKMKEKSLQRKGTWNIKVTIRGAEDIVSELTALVCSMKLITEVSLCPKTDETVLLADAPICKYPPLNSFLFRAAGHPQIRCMAMTSLKLWWPNQSQSRDLAAMWELAGSRVCVIKAVLQPGGEETGLCSSIALPAN